MGGRSKSKRRNSHFFVYFKVSKLTTCLYAGRKGTLEMGGGSRVR